MLAILDAIIKFRQQICPRTSYVTAGGAASTILVLKDLQEEAPPSFEKLLAGLVEKKEFETVQTLGSYDELLHHLDQHVVILLSEGKSDATVGKMLELLKMRKTKVLFEIQSHPQLSSIVETFKHNSVFKWNENEEIYHVMTTSNSLTLKIWYFRRIYKASPNQALKIDYSAIPLGFNRQPAVSSRLQFRFLWDLWTEKIRLQLPCHDEPGNLFDNKRRVLQRLADRDCIARNGQNVKYKPQQWDEWITKALNENCDDWDIYSLIRQKTLGTSLEKDTDPLFILIDQERKSASSSLSTTMLIDTQNNEERSDHLVDRIFECLPEVIQHHPSTYLTSFLDYGCAEGGITAALGKKLQLPPSTVYGADVRSITAHDFQFLRLASETRTNPPAIGTILPLLTENRISLINCSMVFHHVMHIDHVLLELRRVISWENGLLIIREHDCVSPASAAFLDIVHGLYSLAWQNPVEWPDFILEYEAFYRSREQWNDLLLQYGWQLKPSQPKSYDQAVWSVFQPRKDRYSNVIRAYQAVYIPKRDFKMNDFLAPKGMRKTIPNSNNLLVLANPKSVFGTVEISSPMKTMKRQRSQTEENDLPESYVGSDMQVAKRKKSEKVPSYDDYTIHESKNYPGFYYKFYFYQDKCEWITSTEEDELAKL